MGSSPNIYISFSRYLFKRKGWYLGFSGLAANFGRETSVC